ncbi:MAG: glycosyltransferase family 9 protein [Candidatus Aureabacteria bacterium]|nr:glycosyltransferase family 9 protein [Candidatus Auribacterota bacterium]
MTTILIIKPSSLGDIVQALPVAARVRAAAPGTSIAWVVNAQYRRLLEANPCIDHVYAFERHLWHELIRAPRALTSFLRLCRELNLARFDAVLDLQGLFRSGLFTAATASPLRIGFANAREGAQIFYNRRVQCDDPDRHAVDRYLAVADAAGFPGAGVAFPLGIGPAERQWADEALGESGATGNSLYVGLSPSTRWDTKRWPPDRFAALGDALAAQGLVPVIIGGFSGEGGRVAALMRAKARVIEGLTDPLKLAALIARLEVLVTNDSGPMHLAAAAGTPVVALFGPTNPERTGPYGPQHRVICAPVACRPCYHRVCPRKEDCMQAIPAATVLRTVGEVLGR